MEVFILHILKLNIIAAVVILLVKVLATLFKGRVSARWKYFIWLLDVYKRQWMHQSSPGKCRAAL